MTYHMSERIARRREAKRCGGKIDALDYIAVMVRAHCAVMFMVARPRMGMQEWDVDDAEDVPGGVDASGIRRGRGRHRRCESARRPTLDLPSADCGMPTRGGSGTSGHSVMRIRGNLRSMEH